MVYLVEGLLDIQEEEIAFGFRFQVLIVLISHTDYMIVYNTASDKTELGFTDKFGHCRLDGACRKVSYYAIVGIGDRERASVID